MSEAKWLRNNSPESMVHTVYASWGVSSTRGESYNPERLRFFACACIRRVWDLLDDDHRQALILLEQHASAPTAGGPARIRQAYRAASKKLAQQWRRLWQTTWDDGNILRAFSTGKLPWNEGPSGAETDPGASMEIAARCFAASAVWKAAGNKPSTAALACTHSGRAASCRHAAEQARHPGRPAPQISYRHSYYSPEEAAVQCDLLRDIFGNPFRPTVLDRSWLTATVTSLARGAIQDRLDTGDLDSAHLAVLADALEEEGGGSVNRDVLDHLRAPGPHVLGCWPLNLLLEQG
jgi:hypothetical protein